MADDDDYEGEMDGDDFGEEEQMDDLDLEPVEDDAERVQVVEVSSCLVHACFLHTNKRSVEILVILRLFSFLFLMITARFASYSSTKGLVEELGDDGTFDQDLNAVCPLLWCYWSHSKIYSAERKKFNVSARHFLTVKLSEVMQRHKSTVLLT